MQNMSSITPLNAERIIDALRSGVVPSAGIRELSVGRENWLDSVRHDLSFVASGASKLRILSAPWGGGKTHFLQLVKESTSEFNLVVSYVVLHSREAPLDRFEIVFHKIMSGLVFPGGMNLESALDSWASSFPYYESAEIGNELRKLSPSLDFRAALRACLTHSQGDVVAQREVLRNIAGWLQGDSLSPSLKKLGVHNPIKITNVTEILGAFLRFLVCEGYAGLVVMLDEAQAVTSLTQSRRRDEANQNLRKLLDNADEHTGLYIVFATTPGFLNDPTRGAKSYPALWSRIRDVVNMPIAKTSKRSLIISLELLNSEQLTELATKIVTIHSTAYQWDAHEYITNEEIREFSLKFSEDSEKLTIRSFIRPLVFLLDQIEEARDPNVFKSLIKQVRFVEEQDTD